MWVSPFWMGVITTILVEVVVIAIAVAISTHNDKKRKGK